MKRRDGTALAQVGGLMVPLLKLRTFQTRRLFRMEFLPPSDFAPDIRDAVSPLLTPLFGNDANRSFLEYGRSKSRPKGISSFSFRQQKNFKRAGPG
jgi:hypothetical protein